MSRSNSKKIKNIFAGKYKPIDTDRVDDLEHYASEKTHLHLIYRDRTGEVQELRGKIAEVFTKAHQEFLKMNDGRTLRLDQINEIRPDRNRFKSQKL